MKTAIKPTTTGRDKMELIKANNESVEGNEAIRQINIYLLKNEISDVEKNIADCYDRDEPMSAEELEEELENLLDQLDAVENGYIEFA